MRATVLNGKTTEESIELVSGFFGVQNVCLVGASDGGRNAWSFNARVTRTVMRARVKRLQLVGRADGVIHDHPVVDSVRKTDGTGGGLCVLVIRAEQVVPTIREALTVGWDHFLIISELTDKERSELAELIPEEARVWGPNCVGYTDVASGLTFMATDTEYALSPTRGRVALLSQSGGALGLMAPVAQEAGLDVSHLLSTGEEADVGTEDILEYFASTDTTDAVVLFVEEARQPEAFLRALSNCQARNLPVVIVKVGRSEVAQQAAQDHTGALAGNWDEFAATVEGYGAIISESFREAVHVAALLVNNGGQRIGGRTAIFTGSGGAGALAADLIHDTQLGLSPIEGAAEALAEINTRNDTLNPFDSATGGGTAAALRPYLRAIEHDSSVDSLLFITMGGIYGEYIADALTDDLFTKPKVFVSADLAAAQRKQLLDGGVLVATDIADAVAILSKASLPVEKPQANEEPEEDADHAHWSTYTEGTRLLFSLDIPRPTTAWVNPSEQCATEMEFNFPVVVKAGNLRGHKAKYGGVRAGIASHEELDAVVAEMGKVFPELVIEEHAPAGAEILVTAAGGSLGGMLVIGFGGKHVDALGNQVVVRLNATAEEIAQKISETPLYTFLGSWLKSPKQGALTIGRFATKLASAIQEHDLESIEINPVIVNEDDAIACDVKVKTRTDSMQDI